MNDQEIEANEEGLVERTLSVPCGNAGQFELAEFFRSRAHPSPGDHGWSRGSGRVKERLLTHFEVDRYVPTRIDVTPNGGGEHDERAVLERTRDADQLAILILHS